MAIPSLVKPIEILLVEDNPGDVRLTIEALKEAKVINHLTVLKDGVEALAFLRRREPYSSAPRPHLILLDLNLPRMDGREVLAAIKAGLYPLAIIGVIASVVGAHDCSLPSRRAHFGTFRQSTRHGKIDAHVWLLSYVCADVQDC
jgi:CheY-like chemotaxis protein